MKYGPDELVRKPPDKLLENIIGFNMMLLGYPFTVTYKDIFQC